MDPCVADNERQSLLETESSGTYRSDSNTRAAGLDLRPFPMPSVCPQGATPTQGRRDPPLHNSASRHSETTHRAISLLARTSVVCTCAGVALTGPLSSYLKDMTSAAAVARPSREGVSRRRRRRSEEAARLGTTTSAASNAAASELHNSAIPNRTNPCATISGGHGGEFQGRRRSGGVGQDAFPLP